MHNSKVDNQYKNLSFVKEKKYKKWNNVHVHAFLVEYITEEGKIKFLKNSVLKTLWVPFNIWVLPAFHTSLLKTTEWRL